MNRLDHRSEDALRWTQVAADIFKNLDMPDEYERVHLATLRLQLEGGQTRNVAEALSIDKIGKPENALDRLLLSAEVAINQEDTFQAHRLIAEAARKPLALSQRVRLAGIEADYWWKRNDTEQADAILQKAADAVRALAHSSGNRLVRHLLARYMVVIREKALEHLLREADPLDLPRKPPDFAASTVAAAWQWALQTTEMPAQPEDAPVGGGYAAEKLDEAIAAELVGAVNPLTSARAAAHNELLSVLAENGSSANVRYHAERPFDLPTLQSTLREGTLFVALLDGQSHSALLLVTRSSARLVATAASNSLRGALERLRKLTGSSQSGAMDVEMASRRVSDLLWAHVGDLSVPRRIMILAGSSLDVLPWSVVHWPHQAGTLLDTSVVSLVRIAPEPAISAPRNNSNRLNIVVAAQQSASSSLPLLVNASYESRTIQAVVTDRTVVDIEGSAATRASVLAMLREPGAWVHVAAHGLSQPSRVGYAGIWLEPIRSGSPPELLSSLDVLGSDLRADLVVLNACQLSNSGDAMSGNLSFASAVSQAGAKQVVASLWPISDAASAVWVPAFYAALTADPKHDAAEALRIAQLKLRESRMFRHPFYWAGMQTFTRLSIESAPAATSRQLSVKARVH